MHRTTINFLYLSSFQGEINKKKRIQKERLAYVSVVRFSNSNKFIFVAWVSLYNSAVIFFLFCFFSIVSCFSLSSCRQTSTADLIFGVISFDLLLSPKFQEHLCTRQLNLQNQISDYFPLDISLCVIPPEKPAYSSHLPLGFHFLPDCLSFYRYALITSIDQTASLTLSWLIFFLVKLVFPFFSLPILDWWKRLNWNIFQWSLDS